MTEKEIAIQQAVRKLRESIASQMLLAESLSALLPKRKKEKSNGYYTDPFGKRQYYNKKAERQHEKDKFKLITKEGTNG